MAELCLASDGDSDVVQVAELCLPGCGKQKLFSRRLQRHAAWQLKDLSTVTLSAELVKPCWYAAYTAPRHEKAVMYHLGSRCVEAFLPLYSSTRRWNKRRAVVQLPLFPGYLFVHIRSCDRQGVLQTPGVLSIIASNGHLIPIPDAQIEGMRAALQARDSQPHPFLSAGKRVRITTGPLCGLEGVVVRETRQLRMIVSIESIKQSFSIELDSCDLEVCQHLLGRSATAA